MKYDVSFSFTYTADGFIPAPSFKHIGTIGGDVLELALAMLRNGRKTKTLDDLTFDDLHIALIALGFSKIDVGLVNNLAISKEDKIIETYIIDDLIFALTADVRISYTPNVLLNKGPICFKPVARYFKPIEPVVLQPYPILITVENASSIKVDNVSAIILTALARLITLGSPLKNKPLMSITIP